MLLIVHLLLFSACSRCYFPCAAAVLLQNAKKEQVIEISATQHKPLSSATDAAAAMPQPVSAAVSEEEVDIDLADPEVLKAAVLIQSGFKGFKHRKISQGYVKVDYLPFGHFDFIHYLIY